MYGKIVNGKGVSLLARLRLREVSESEEGFNRLERAMRYGKRLKLAKRVPRDVFMPEDKKLWFLFERIYRVVHDKEVAVLRRFGLTPMQYNVLEFVVNVNIRMYNFDDVQCTVIPSVAYGFVTGMNLQLC